MARCKRVVAGTALMAFKCAIAAGTWPDNIFCAAGANPADKNNNAAHVAVASYCEMRFSSRQDFNSCAVDAMLILCSNENHGWLTR